MEQNPLVSVFIVTYNSSDYIVEALDSVKAQTYNNIELIVSDDCSQDNTVAIIKDWISENGSRFVRTNIVETPVNKGIPANYNRAVNACRGEWLKMMDGDDLLIETCIEKNLNFISENSDAKVVFSDEYRFHNVNVMVTSIRHFKPWMKEFFTYDVEKQLKTILKGNFIPSQTCFIKSSLLNEYPYDESYRLLEDYPMWIKLLKKGVRFSYFDECTAKYRIADSVSASKKTIIPSFYNSIVRAYFWKELYPLMKENNYSYEYNYQRSYFLWCDLCEIILRNKNNAITKPISIILRAFTRSFVRFNL